MSQNARHSTDTAHDYRFTGGYVSRRGDAASPALRIASILGHANYLCVMSGLRFGFRSTKRLCQAQLRLLGHLARPDSADHGGDHMLRILVDEARGCLREVADASAHEFHHLQRELGNLGEKARSVVHEPQTLTDQHVRRGKAKP